MKLLLIILLLALSGCRIVHDETVVKIYASEDVDISLDQKHENSQAADKKLGDIAPNGIPIK